MCHYVDEPTGFSLSGTKLFPCSTQLSMEFELLLNIKIAKINENSDFENQSQSLYLLINVKIPTFFDILIFLSTRNFMLNSIEHAKKCFNLMAMC